MRHFPAWLTKKVQYNRNTLAVKNVLAKRSLHTVCISAKCPNRSECFGLRRATFLILGNICTRQCGFCAIAGGQPVDRDFSLEIDGIIAAVEQMQLNYVVITSVTRDDLPDGGASVFHQAIGSIKKRFPGIRVEVLIPDFKGNADAINRVLAAGPDVLNHNLETVRSLYPAVRPAADYDRSLKLLAEVKNGPGVMAKSGMMLGMGEKNTEVVSAMKDIFETGCAMLTLGQYLAPSRKHRPVSRFIPPDEFKELELAAYRMGFKRVAAGPFVRSSYHAERLAS